MEKGPNNGFLGLEFREAAGLSAGDVLKRLGTTPAGLSPGDAARRLTESGPNALATKTVTAFDILFRQFVSPMTGLLFVAAAVSLLLGQTLDGVTVLVILGINAGIGFVQEFRSENALKTLAKHLNPRARVRRDGAIAVVSRSELVPGDVVILEPGDIAPADLRLIAARNLIIDESVLTGESAVVGKSAAAVQAATPSAAAGTVFMMSRVVSGGAEGVVTATARATIMGKAAMLADETVRVSGFEKNIGQLSGFLLKAVMLVLLVVFSANLYLKGADQFVPQLLFAIAMAVSVIPEALPAVTAITLTKGALHLARKHVVVRRLTSIEDLGHIEVLCTDKTGTITRGVMEVQDIDAADRDTCLLYGLLASADEEFSDLKTPKTFGAALMVGAGEDVLKRHREAERSWFMPFDPSRRRTTGIAEAGGLLTLVSMGAPETILDLCTLPAAQRQAIEKAVAERGRRGWRVLAVAAKPVIRKERYDDADESGLRYVGCLAFADPLKTTAKDAIKKARQLSVRVKILTGDGPEVAGAIGYQTGIIEDPDDVVTGTRLDAMTPEEFRDAVDGHDVFARVTPEQKYRIIAELQRDRQVGFLGEGINDAPALKLADVSLVVDHASDVARDSADIILLRKDLHVIIDGIRDGRAIFANIVKYLKYTMVGNMGNFAAIVGISLVIDYLPMLPVQILLTNLLTDLPLAAVADDRVDEQELRTPRKFNIRELAFGTVFLGLVSSLFDFLYFAAFRSNPPAVVQTGWFTFSIITELALIYSLRTRKPFWRAVRPGKLLAALSIVAAAVALVLPLSGLGAGVFRFAALSSSQIGVILVLVLLYFVSTESVKLMYAKIFNIHRTNPI
jgi:Mg2+-importing ATPase